jgi:hypothetical protein
MMTIARGLAIGVVLAGAAIGLASPASAELTPGQYTGTMLDAGASGKQVGTTVVWPATPCGPDCMHLGDSPGWDLHLQGNTWTGTNQTGAQASLDNSSLILTVHYPNADVIIGLTKNG